ncbi:phosphatidyl-myo-inositol mannosyltransferase [Bombiscardovia apis]|uniref:Phosphatidyl-myo-inositol mannosyltransferase n=1 Tax=Bombiscardovia apis TaxID=2932182 RepID=A0ABM8BC26_9BIFI|nr:glycosyltransferase family 4 protein [Bombiscardovia apis]BDR54444.1 phosphatidyl-myo-inositol mannosyltransferase [Bombiscardovia apis]
MKALTIGFVFDDTLDVLDGVQQHILTLGRELSKRGHEVHYLVGQTEHPPVANVHSLSRNKLVSFNGNQMRIPLFASDAAIRQVLERVDFDILHVQAPYSPMLAGRVLQRASAKTGLVATYHIATTGRLQLLAGQFLGLINAPSHRSIDQVIAVSEVAARYAQLTAGARGSIIPNPVDVAQLELEREAAGPEAVERYREGGPHIVFLGRFVPRKGAQLLLDALAWGEHEGIFPQGMHVTMAGKGPLLDTCREQAQHLRTQVEFPGFVSESDKPTLLASADVAVFPSSGGESFGIVLLEAIASGAGQTLAGDNPGYRSTLLNDEDALFPVAGEPELLAQRLAERIARAFDDQVWAQRLGKREYQLLERYDVKSVANQVETVYQQALTGKRAQ